MALSFVELDYQFEPTYEEQRLKVEQDLYGISRDINFPYEIPKVSIEDAVFDRLQKPPHIINLSQLATNKP